jgi:hypothetical protein
MTYTVRYARSGLTAIAAVLALSSTPIAAQDVTDTPPPAAETTASPAPEAAQEPVASEPVATETTATETTAAEPTEAEAPAPATTTRRAATRTRDTAPTRRATSEAATNAAPASAMPATEAMAEAMPVPPPTGATIDPGAMPVDETAATPETSAMPSDETLAIVGAAGLGIFALGGIGMAIGRRRKRKEEEAHMAANRAYLDSHPVGDAPNINAPAFATTSAAMAAGTPGPMLRDAPRTRLPEGFDLSRFGPHVRAAYQGPTEDNPSLSMKHRLRRAAAMDQQLRQHGEAPREAAQRPAAQAKPAMKPVFDANGRSFMLRRSDNKPTSKPAFQH